MFLCRKSKRADCPSVSDEGAHCSSAWQSHVHSFVAMVGISLYRARQLQPCQTTYLSIGLFESVSRRRDLHVHPTLPAFKVVTAGCEPETGSCAKFAQSIYGNRECARPIVGFMQGHPVMGPMVRNDFGIRAAVTFRFLTTKYPTKRVSRPRPLPGASVSAGSHSLLVLSSAWSDYWGNIRHRWLLDDEQ